MTVVCTPLTFDSTAVTFDSVMFSWDQTEVCAEAGAAVAPPITYWDSVLAPGPRRKRKRHDYRLLLLG